MGLQDEKLPDVNITASTFYSIDAGPNKGRLHNPSSWSAKIVDKGQFLEVRCFFGDMFDFIKILMRDYLRTTNIVFLSSCSTTL